MKAARSILRSIEKLPAGEPFTTSALLQHGTRAAVDHALSRFARTGLVTRVARGVYVRPRTNRYVGQVPPSPEAVAQALVAQAGAKVQMTGAEAAVEFQLTTQQPVTPVFHTSGPSRRFRMGKLEVTLKHVSARKLALAGRPAGVALAALWYLGRREVTEAVIEQVRRKLPAEEFRALEAAAASQPAWMAAAFRRHARTRSHGPALP